MPHYCITETCAISSNRPCFVTNFDTDAATHAKILGQPTLVDKCVMLPQHILMVLTVEQPEFMGQILKKYHKHYKGSIHPDKTLNLLHQT